MRRTQILLAEDQYQALQKEAQATGKSLSALVRGCVDQHLHELERDPLLDLIGSIQAEDDTSPEDLAVRHDAYLYGDAR